MAASRSSCSAAEIYRPVLDKNISVGFGFGHFEDERAIALGTKALIGLRKDIAFTAGVGYSSHTTALSAGLGGIF